MECRDGVEVKDTFKVTELHYILVCGGCRTGRRIIEFVDVEHVHIAVRVGKQRVTIQQAWTIAE